MARALKVFRTPIGFHDAYVAAPTQKAAIEAWGSGKDVFARGQAELVTDPALTAEPLASPGVVVKRLRGTAEEQIAALGPDKPGRAAPKTHAAKPATAKPRPKRTALDAVERALEEAKARHAARLETIAGREAALMQEKRALQKAQAEETARLAAKRDAAEVAYDEAMRRWRENS